MKNQIQIASEVNNSSSAGKLASVVRKNRRILIFAVAFLFVLSPAYAGGPKVLDKSVPADQSAILYFHKEITIYDIDGKSVKFLGLSFWSQPVKGKGSKKNPDAMLQIPAGECKVKGEYLNYGKSETTFAFLPGRHYQLLVEPAAKGDSAGKQLGNMALGKFDANWDIQDITDKVKK